jgi:carotenoid cleavage dioxygenase-like enzyme
MAQSAADILTPTPVIEPAGNRYILMVLDQPSRDLTKGRSKVNMLLDTKTGKTWILEFGVKAHSNENGYVWYEVPFNQAPK